jgi:hypothetical protein
MASTFPTSLDTFTNPTATSLLTSPSHSLSHSDLNDAVEALEAKVAIGNTVLGVYQSYTPTASTWSPGNGTWTAAYCRVNNFVHAWGSFVFGSTSSITTTLYVGVPVNIEAGMVSPSSSGSDFILGDCSFVSAAAPTVPYFGVACSNSATGLRLHLTNTASTYAGRSTPNGTTPFTWTTGDSFRFSVIYEAA